MEQRGHINRMCWRHRTLSDWGTKHSLWGSHSNNLVLTRGGTGQFASSVSTEISILSHNIVFVNEIKSKFVDHWYFVLIFLN